MLLKLATSCTELKVFSVEKRNALLYLLGGSLRKKKDAITVDRIVYK